MQITKFTATKVHGYLEFDITFYPELTFLTGLNGSGKTTALRLIMALLTPNLDDFISIDFETASVLISIDEQLVEICAKKSLEGLEIKLSNILLPLVLSTTELQLFSESRSQSDSRSPVYDKIVESEVFLEIKKLSTPMFLGLDRRFYTAINQWDDSSDARRRDYHYRKLLADNPALRGTSSAGLVDVNHLVSSRMREILAAQELLDDSLRKRVLTRAFEYKPSDFTSFTPPSRRELESYRDRLASIEKAAEGLRLPVPELNKALSGFFEGMSKVVDALEKAPIAAKTEIKQNRKHSKNTITTEQETGNPVLVEWIINKPQADRILEHLRLLDQYSSDRASLREPINKFTSLVNGFLQQTRKKIATTPIGDLVVYRDGDKDPRPINALSSGERQLLVMVAHLSLNKSLINSGIFIVDEPELSLHIDWQERFVEAIREANPKVQIIMATHSPAIILDRIDHCISLNNIL